jgi:2-oxoglutarate dehydrogenase E2 component (dihydrolipoamide succinyltransferase)
MIAIKVPPLGESVVEATVSRWAKQPGDAVAAGETIVELETDKVTVEVPALKPGVLVSQAKQAGDVVKVDELLGQVDETAVPATVAAPAQATASASSGAPAAGAAAVPASGATTTPPRKAVEGAVRASPAAQRVAARDGIDLATVAGTGRGGVVSKSDVIEQASRGATSTPQPPALTRPAPAVPSAPPAPARPAQPNGGRAPAAAGPRETREKMTTRRKRIAENLVQAQHTTAHLTTFNEIDMSAVSALRERLRERVEREHGVKLSFMPFFVKAACVALQQYPVVNAQIEGDSIVYKHYVNMGIAVASDQGLVVPVIRDADAKGMLDIAREITDLAAVARAGKLAVDDLMGGTFTITNGGVFGSLVSTPILNYPQVGILGLHKIQDRPIAVNGQVVIRPMMYVALSYDHRLVDGQQAVLFLLRIKELMEDPASMLVT